MSVVAGDASVADVAEETPVELQPGVPQQRGRFWVTTKNLEADELDDTQSPSPKNAAEDEKRSNVEGKRDARHTLSAVGSVASLIVDAAGDQDSDDDRGNAEESMEMTDLKNVLEEQKEVLQTQKELLDMLKTSAAAATEQSRTNSIVTKSPRGLPDNVEFLSIAPTSSINAENRRNSDAEDSPGITARAKTPSLAASSRIVELTEEMASIAPGLVLENDALRAKTHALSKKVKDLKSKLEEARNRISNLEELSPLLKTAQARVKFLEAKLAAED